MFFTGHIASTYLLGQLVGAPDYYTYAQCIASTLPDVIPEMEYLVEKPDKKDWGGSYSFIHKPWKYISNKWHLISFYVLVWGLNPAIGLHCLMDIICHNRVTGKSNFWWWFFEVLFDSLFILKLIGVI